MARCLATPTRAGMVGTAMDGHNGQLRLVAALLVGQPASMVLAPTLDEVTGVVKLAGAVATASGRMRRWRGHTGHPRPPRSYWLVCEQL